MSREEQKQKLSHVQTIDPSAQVIEDVPAAVAFNPLERERLKGMMRSFHGDSALLDLSDDELDKALDFVRIRDGIAYPTIAGLLLIGHEQYIREYVPGNEVLFQVLDGVNVLVNPPAMRGPLLSIFETVNLMFRSRVTEQGIHPEFKGILRFGKRNRVHETEKHDYQPGNQHDRTACREVRKHLEI